MLQNLDDRTPITNEDGSPTQFFMRLLQQRGGLIEVSQDTITSLLALNIIAGLDLDGGGTVQAAIDADSTTPIITIDHAVSGVSAGSYTNSNITVDAQGHITAASNGSGVSTVAGLPSAAPAGAGARRFVTDATATTFLSTVAGGGANKVPVVSDGTNWLIG